MDAPKRTMVAQQAMDMSEQIALLYSKRVVGSVPGPGFHLRLTVPDGPSTDGGKKSRQSFSLVPVDGIEGNGVMMGWLDVKAKKASFRSHRTVDLRHEKRFADRFKVSISEFDELVQQLSQVLMVNGYEVEKEARATNSKATTSPDRAQSGSKTTNWLLLVAAVLALVTATAVVVFRSR